MRRINAFRLLVLLSMVSSQVFSQGRTITGRIADTNGEVMPGVTVMIKNTTIGSITDVEGNYSINNVEKNAILSYSFIGMLSQDIPVLDQRVIDVVLQANAVGLEDLVVVGYGSQKRASMTGAVTSVSAKKLTVAPVASATNALTGRVPGLISVQSSGVPGGDAAVLNIRGFGSPLVIVDGVESGFNNIDASEIESITVLKDASAAIYGVRAGNGVILVTTKRGEVGKPTITLNTSYSLQAVTDMMAVASSAEIAELMNEKATAEGVDPPYSQVQIDKYRAGNDPDYPNTDWWDVATDGKTYTPQQQYNLAIRGGSEKMKYYGFIGYLNQVSMFGDNGGEYDRFNLRSNIDAQILDNLNFELDVSSIWEVRDFPRREYNESGGGGIWGEYWNSEPRFASSLPDPNKIAFGGPTGSISLDYITNSAQSGYKKQGDQNTKVSGALNYEFKFAKGLKARGFLNLNQSYGHQKVFSYLKPSHTYEYAGDIYTQQTQFEQPSLSEKRSEYRKFTGQLSLNYKRTFASHHDVSALALYEAYTSFSDGLYGSRINFPTDQIDYMYNGSLAGQEISGAASEMGRESYIGRINYAYMSKYLLESTIRIDASAQFSEENRTGFFPSLSLGWRVSEENFIKNNVSYLQNLKLRASISQTGNANVGGYPYISGYTSSTWQPYVYGTNTYQGLKSMAIANPDLTWEVMTTSNVGLDFTLFEKFSGEFDAFYRLRDGIPGRRASTIPDTFGASLPLENLNSISTRGFEAMLIYNGKIRDFHYSIGGNISWSRSRYEDWDETSTWADPDTERQSKKSGQWTDVSFGYKSDGLFATDDEVAEHDPYYTGSDIVNGVSPGDIKYLNTNNDTIIDTRDMVDIGRGTTPHWMMGLNFDIDYKGFDLSLFFQGALGFYHDVKFNEGFKAMPKIVYDERWYEGNQDINALVPRLGGATSNGWASDYRYKKANYLRLKTLSFGYTLPQAWSEKANLKSLRVYFSGTNLLTFSGLKKYSIDPEAPSGLGGRYYPQMRTLAFGLQLAL